MIQDLDMRSEFPLAVDPGSVGTYPVLTNCGGGLFYDEVLEWRVWMYKAMDATGCFTFASYEEALEYAETTSGAEPPLVLVLQREWIDEPTSGTYVHHQGERIAEWKPEWLLKGPRKPGDIEAKLQESK